MQKHRLVSIGIAVLAVLQGVFGVLRAFAYFRIGGELAGQGIILIPLLRSVVYGRVDLLSYSHYSPSFLPRESCLASAGDGGVDSSPLYLTYCSC